MAVDTSELKFPKPGKKKNKTKLRKKSTVTMHNAEEKEETVAYEEQVDHMADFYVRHAPSLQSIHNYRFTMKLKLKASAWIQCVLDSQPGSTIQHVIEAWECTVLMCENTIHESHKDFINFWWLVKNDSNYLDVMEGKFNKEFKQRGNSAGSKWGSSEDFKEYGSDGPDTYI